MGHIGSQHVSLEVEAVSPPLFLTSRSFFAGIHLYPEVQNSSVLICFTDEETEAHRLEERD